MQISLEKERLDLPYWAMIFAICVVMDVSKCMDTRTLEFFNKGGAFSTLTWLQEDIASAVVLRILKVLISRPLLWQPSSVMLVIFVQQILRISSIICNITSKCNSTFYF